MNYGNVLRLTSIRLSRETVTRETGGNKHSYYPFR